MRNWGKVTKMTTYQGRNQQVNKQTNYQTNLRSDVEHWASQSWADKQHVICEWNIKMQMINFKKI